MKAILVSVFITGILGLSGPAWSASTKEEIKALSVQVEAMQKDLTEIKTLLKQIKTAPSAAARPAAPTFKEQVVSNAGSPFMGNADAPITIVEYSDYQCPYCARHYRNVLPQMKTELIDTGQVKFVMRELPLTSIHPNAMNASNAALCAKDQGQYFEMHNLLFENQRVLTIENLKSFAADLGMDTITFDKCLDSNMHQEQINNDIASSRIYGITGTPAFAIGLTDQQDTDKANMKNVIKGAQGYANFKGQVDLLLDSAD